MVQHRRDTAHNGGVRPSPRLWLQPVTVSMVIALAFVGLYLGFGRSPVPHRIPLAVVGQGLADRVEPALGNAIQVRQVADGADGDRLLRNADVSGVLLSQGGDLHLDVAGASGLTTVTALEHGISGFSAGAQKPLKVRDLVPLSRFDSRGMAGFYVSFGVSVASLALAQNLFAASASLRARWRFLTTLGFNIVVGTPAGILAGPVFGAIPAPLLPTAVILTLLSSAAAFTQLALRSWVGPIGIPLGTLLFVTVGNSTSGGVIGEDLLPAPARAVSPLLPPGATVRALRDAGYFGGSHLAGPLLTLCCWTVLAGALAGLHARFRRAPRHGAIAGRVSLSGAIGSATGVTAVITDSDGQVIGHTAIEADGRFRVDRLPTGEVTVTVVCPGCAPHAFSTQVSPDRTTTVEFVVRHESVDSRQQGLPTAFVEPDATEAWAAVCSGLPGT